MIPELRNAFEQYVRLAIERLRPNRHAPGGRGSVRLVANRTRETRDTVAALEREEAFGALVAATGLAFHAKPRRDRHAVETFFRRSGFYLCAAAGEEPLVDEVLTQYAASFESREHRVTLLAPLEHVSFARDALDFGAFRLQSFSRTQLEGLFQTAVNRVFYEWALTDVGILPNYWFLTLTTTAERTRTFLNFADIDKVTPTFTSFRAIEEALLPLVSFPWQADLWRGRPPHEQLDWHGFRIPFLLVVDDNFLAAPRHRPDLVRLDTEPAFNSMTGEELDFERPVIWTHLDTDEADVCEASVRELVDRLRALGSRPTEWGFFDRACGYFLKAFFADGFEQLLWHITTVDALLGEDAPGAATKRLARRVAAILGTAPTEQETLRAEFLELYHFRSRFVHGPLCQRG